MQWEILCCPVTLTARLIRAEGEGSESAKQSLVKTTAAG
jgi:hypothetical protein